ncbi:MAG: tetratricopeptide repeat protein [Bryobacteraceae bacterium]
MLPFDNQTGENAADWLSVAVQGVLADQLAVSQARHVFPAPAIRDAYLGRASAVLHGYVAKDSQGRLRLKGYIEDLVTHRTVRHLEVRMEGDRVLEAAGEIARQLDPGAQPFGTSNLEALRHYAEGLAESEPSKASAAFERSVAADPNFGPGYVAWVRQLAAMGDRERVGRVLGAARDLDRSLRPIDRAQLNYLAVSLRGDAAARIRAMKELATLTPNDSDLMRNLALAVLRIRDYQAAVHWYGRAAALEPSDPAVWNQLAYTQAYTGDLKGAVGSLEVYRKLTPESPNPDDSLGDVHFHAGQFAEAEKHFVAAQSRDPRFLGGGSLLKAAHARLMRGDVEGADEQFGGYLEIRKQLNDPLIEYRRAQWEYLSGRHKQAAARLESFARGQRADSAALAYAQLAVWLLQQGGDREAVREYARRAAESARSPQSANLAAICRFLAGAAGTASEFAVRAEREFPDPGQSTMKQYALAYALLLHQHFREASLVLREILEQTTPFTAGQLNALLAWALIESDQVAEARSYLETWPIPEAQGEPTFSSLVLPRLFYLRGVLLESEGRAEESRQSFALFLKLAGEKPTIFGDRERARAALAR